MAASPPPAQPFPELRHLAGGRSLQARLLGPVQLTTSERNLPPTAWPRRSARSLLLLLLATPGHRVTRERAVDLLWPDLPPEHVPSTWYQSLSTLRRVLEPDLAPRQKSAFVVTDAATVSLDLRLELSLDVDAFEDALRRSDASAAEGRRASLQSALALYQGDLLAEEPDEAWTASRREELHFAWQRAVLNLADLDLQAGEPLRSVPALQQVLATDRTAEEMHRALIRAFVAAGERDWAWRQYEWCRQVLRDELGIEPDDATHRFVATDEGGVAPELSASVTESITVPRRRLPTPATSLIGRDREIALIEDLLWSPDARLMTLIGPGGIGKTRLAIEIAAHRESEGMSVAFVPLDSIRTPELVLPTVGQALGVRNDGGSSYLASVLRHIGEHALLLVLDNFEHVVAAGAVVGRLLAGCPHLTVLITSRAPLHLAAEHIVAVPPLSLPGARQPSFATLARSEAVTLFVQRARAAKADFSLTEANAPTIGRLCAQLDGLPLAIELAAARVRVLSPRAMLARLDQRLNLLDGGPRDAPVRLRTMRHAIGWSYDLLTERERALFRRLAIFAGGASMAAAESVAGPATLDLLAALVNHNLLQHEEQSDGEPRFAMLETVRAYAMEQLEASGEDDAIRRRHVAWAIAFAEETVPCLTRTVQPAELERIAAEIDNIRAALAWALAHGESVQALRLARATFQLWFARATPCEGLRWLEASLAAAPDAPEILCADALLCAAMLAFIQADVPRQESHAAAALAVSQACGYQFGVALALHQFAIIAERRLDLEEAAARYEEILAMMRQSGDAYWTTLLLMNLSTVNLMRGRLVEAAGLANEGLRRWREMENHWGIAQGLSTLAAIARQQGDHRRAAELYLESLSPWSALGDRQGIAGALVGVAGLAAEVDLASQAARLLAAADAFGAGTGVRILAHNAEYEQSLSATRAQLDDRAFSTEWAAGQALSLEHSIAEARRVAEMIVAEVRSFTEPMR